MHTSTYIYKVSITRRDERVKITAIRYAETEREQCEGERNMALAGPCLSRTGKFADFVRKIDSRTKRGGRMGAAEWEGVCQGFVFFYSPFFYSLLLPFIF